MTKAPLKGTALFFLAAVFACNSNPRKASPDSFQLTMGEAAVELVRPEQRSLEAPLKMQGQMAFPPRLALFAEEAGIVASIFAKPGQNVRKGDSLLLLRNAALEAELLGARIRYEEARKDSAVLAARMSKAEAERTLLKKQFDRIARKYGRVASVTLEKYDEAETAYLKARADYEMTRAELLHADEALQLARQNLELLEARAAALLLRAPVDAQVAAVHVLPGTRAHTDPRTATPLLDLVRKAPQRLVVDVPLVLADALVAEQKVRIDFPGQDARFLGELAYAPVPLDSLRARTEIVFEQPDPELKPGMQATVETLQNIPRNSWWVPEDALLFTPKGPRLHVFDGRSLQALPALPGEVEDGWVEVWAPSLTGDLRLALFPFPKEPGNSVLANQ